MTEASDFKFGMQQEFAKAHDQNSTRRKIGRGPGLVDLPKMCGFPFNISVTAEANDFKSGMGLRFIKARENIPPRRKVGVALVWGAF